MARRKAKVAVAPKLAVTMLAMLKSGRPYEDGKAGKALVAKEAENRPSCRPHGCLQADERKEDVQGAAASGNPLPKTAYVPSRQLQIVFGLRVRLRSDIPKMNLNIHPGPMRRKRVRIEKRRMALEDAEIFPWTKFTLD